MNIINPGGNVCLSHLNSVEIVCHLIYLAVPRKNNELIHIVWKS